MVIIGFLAIILSVNDYFSHPSVLQFLYVQQLEFGVGVGAVFLIIGLGVWVFKWD